MAPRSTSLAAVGHEPAGPRLASYRSDSHVWRPSPLGLRSQGTFRGRTVPRSASGLRGLELRRQGAARECEAPKSSGERGGLGTGSQEQRLRARPGECFRAAVAGQSRSRRLVETAEKVGRPGGLSPGVERLVSYQNA
jgi:hypothetical protein